jgi:hypothetical protein
MSVARELVVLQWCLFIYLFIFFALLTNLLPEGVLPSIQAYMVSGSKFHLVGTLERSFCNFLNSFLMRKERLPRIEDKTVNIRIRQIGNFHSFIISKIKTWKSWNFYPIFNLVIYLRWLRFYLNFCNFGLFIGILVFEVSMS